MLIPGKILLFGEYAILKGGDALAVPLLDFGGELLFKEGEGMEQSNASLKLFYQHIKVIQQKLQVMTIDLDRLLSDLKLGVWFYSTIPQKAGLGSSGALVAAIVHEYGVLRSKKLSLIQHDLAILESYFHGNSSGIDPLVCYTGDSVCVSKGNVNRVKKVQLPAFERLPVGGKGSTEHLVAQFQKDLKNPDYAQLFNETYVVLQNKIINHVVKGESPVPKAWLLELSALQFELFNAMIPNDSLALWKKGLRTKSFALKLCGSGGGGHALRFNF